MITIEGYSGCHVCVKRYDSGAYIVEKSCSPSYKPRLMFQKDKQIKARKDLRIDGIVVPEVLFGQDIVREGNQSCGYLMGMSFYHHHDAVTYISFCSTQKVWELSKLIQSFLRRSVELCVDGGAPQPLPCEVMKAKIRDVVRVLEGNAVVAGMEEEQGIIAYVKDVVAPTIIDILEKNSDGNGCIHIPLGHCHGDLTLSNILLTETDNGCKDGDNGCNKDGEPSSSLTLVLIDFLDSFVESPLADLAKLFQDLKYGWTLRLLLAESAKSSVGGDGGGSNSSSSTLLCPLSVFTSMEYMMGQIEQVFAGCEWFRLYHGVFLVLNQLRVLQYAKDPSIAKYLLHTVVTEMATIPPSSPPPPSSLHRKQQ